MGDDSTCLLHGFSYASAIPNESKQGTPMHALGESISFGRFMAEPLSWEKWSSFSSHKKYVEEAARFAQPGSVAQKKAFFEAHYKRIAAQKAAALLEQENAAKNAGNTEENMADQQQEVVLDSNLDVEEREEDDEAIHDNNDQGLVSVVDVGEEGENEAITGNESFGDSSNKVEHILANQETVCESESSGTPQMERPLLKQNSIASEDVPSVTSKKKAGLASLKSSIQRRTWKVPSTPASKPVTPQFKKETKTILSTRKSNANSIDNKRSSPKSLRALIEAAHVKEPDKEPTCATKKAASSVPAPNSSRTTPKACKTPLRTPNVAATKGVSKYPAATPRSENRRMKTPVDPSVSGTKTTGPRWQVLSAVKSLTGYRNKLQSPTLSTPFTLRTEERAAKRKQKLEEKFNAKMVVQRSQTQKTLKEKAGDEFRKMSCGFCFKARPLPDFYKEREASINQMKKTPVEQPQPAVLGRSKLNKMRGTVSMPAPPPPPTTSLLAKNSGASKTISSRNNGQDPRKFLTTSLRGRISRENKSPNIQH